MIEEYLILRLDAPLMSFGKVMVDNYNPTERYPSLSAITGLLANAMGYDHSQYVKTQSLQGRLCMAVRCDRHGTEVRDFQTASMNQEFMLNKNAWTTWNRMDVRKGGSDAQLGTHIRYRDYLADAIYTIAVRLADSSELPILDELECALISPARPLFIGRKSCLPAAQLVIGRGTASSPLDALRNVKPISHLRRSSPIEEGLSAWWSPDDGCEHPGPWREMRISDKRDWLNQIHSGERLVHHGLIYPNGVDHD